MTKVWGFVSPEGPLQFRAEGWRKRAREMLNAGDLVVLVGTKGEPTAKADRGRLLGVMEPTTQPVMSLDFDLPYKARNYDEQGRYRWPYGLLNLRAWHFQDRPLLANITERRFNMDAVLGIVPLTDGEAEAVLRLQREEVPLLETTAATQARLRGDEVARRRTAPVPTTTRRGVMHMRNAPAYTYAFEVLGARPPAYKIGWAFDYEARARTFNQSAMPALGGLRYQTELYHLWDSARQAYRMEQLLLARFSSCRHSANHEILHGISKEELVSAWADSIAECRSRS